MNTAPWIDISVPVFNGIVHWPDDPQYAIEHVTDLNAGDVCTVSKITLCAHTGTHMDAPGHFIASGLSIDQIPLDAAMGAARVIEVRDPHSIRREHLLAHAITPGERILFKTVNSDRAWTAEPFNEKFVYIARDAAAYLAERQVRCVGVDYLSVGGFSEDGPETHRALLGAGIWIIEGLDLREVQPGSYELICLPLKLLGAEGAPARAILKPVGA